MKVWKRKRRCVRYVGGLLVMILLGAFTACTKQEPIPEYPFPISREDLEQVIADGEFPWTVGEQLSPTPDMNTFYELNAPDGVRAYYVSTAYSDEVGRMANITVPQTKSGEDVRTSYEQQQVLLDLLCRMYGLSNDGGLIAKAEQYLSQRNPSQYLKGVRVFVREGDLVLSASYRSSRAHIGAYAMSNVSIQSYDSEVAFRRRAADSEVQRLRDVEQASGKVGYYEVERISQIPFEKIAQYDDSAMVAVAARMTKAVPSEAETIKELRFGSSEILLYPADYYILTLQDESGDTVEVLADREMIELDMIGKGQLRYYLRFRPIEGALCVQCTAAIEG